MEDGRMPTTPKPTAARQQRRRHRGRRCVSGRNRAWVGPGAKRKACFPLTASTLDRGRGVLQTLFHVRKPAYSRVSASAYATQRARVPQRFGRGQMFQRRVKVLLRGRFIVAGVTLLVWCPAQRRGWRERAGEYALPCVGRQNLVRASGRSRFGCANKAWSGRQERAAARHLE